MKIILEADSFEELRAQAEKIFGLRTSDGDNASIVMLDPITGLPLGVAPVEIPPAKKPKAKRRTKAQIEADKLAAAGTPGLTPPPVAPEPTPTPATPPASPTPTPETPAAGMVLPGMPGSAAGGTVAPAPPNAIEIDDNGLIQASSDAARVLGPDKVLAHIATYQVETVSDIKPEHRAHFIQSLQAMIAAATPPAA